MYGAAGASSAQAPVITTIVGGDGGPDPGTNVSIQPCGVSAGQGYIYPSGGYVTWRLTPGTDSVAPVAGVGAVTGNPGNGVPAGTATLNGACRTATDSHGNLLLAARAENLIRVVSRNKGTYYGLAMIPGRIYTIAGTGATGFSGDGGPALKAELNQPESVTTDLAGNVVISDTGNDRIRVVAVANGTFYGLAMKAGDIYTVFSHAGTMDETVVDPSGNLVIADTGNKDVIVVPAADGTYYGQQMVTGSIYPIATLTTAPGGNNDYWGVTVDGSGNVVFVDWPQIKVVAATAGTFYGQSMIPGGIYAVAGTPHDTQYDGDGIPALQAGISPAGVAVDAQGNLVIADGGTQGLIRVVAPVSGTYYGQSMTAGDIYSVAGNHLTGDSGNDGPATAAELRGTGDTGVDKSGNILIPDFANDSVRLLAGQTGTFYGQSMVQGDIYTVSPHLGITVQPTGAAVDDSGNLIIAADLGSTEGRLYVAPQQSGAYYGQPMTAGQVYVIGSSSSHLTSVRIDHHGNPVFTESGTGSGGGVYVVAATSGDFYGHQMSPGQIEQVAGGGAAPVTNGVPAVQAYLAAPHDTIVDYSGNLVIADAGANMIRVVAESTGKFYGQSMKAGYIYDVAGTGSRGMIGNAGPALKAELCQPGGVTVDGPGNLVIADTCNNMIRVVALKSGTYYGQSMTGGDIYLIAGTGRAAFGGDGGSALAAWIDAPVAVRVQPGGDILVSDDNRIREITP